MPRARLQRSTDHNGRSEEVKWSDVKECIGTQTKGGGCNLPDRGSAEGKRNNKKKDIICKQFCSESVNIFLGNKRA